MWSTELKEWKVRERLGKVGPKAKGKLTLMKTVQ